jgi:hypothetical protein
MIERETSPCPMVSVYDGERCVGFVISRGKEGFEAFDIYDISIGTFTTMAAAADAVAACDRQRNAE